MAEKPEFYTVPQYSQDGTRLDDVRVPSTAFGGCVRIRTLHDAVVAYEANRRVGTATAKTRAQVNLNSKKMYRQKGTGRARAGSRTSPIRIGGGVAHPPRMRDYTKFTPRKVRRAALASALYSKFRDGQVRILDRLALARPRTREIATLLHRVDADGRALVSYAATGQAPPDIPQPAPTAGKRRLAKRDRRRAEQQHLAALTSATAAQRGHCPLSDADRNIVRSVRNIPGVLVAEARDLNAYDVLRHRYLVLTREAFDLLVERFR